MMRRILLVLFFALAMPAWGAVSVQVNMRDIGYTVGDIIKSNATLALASGQSIDRESLPAIGRITPWLELRSVELGTENRIDFVWQVFATVETVQTLKLPAVEIKLTGNKPESVTIPAQAFQMSPVLPYPLEAAKPRANLPPFRFDEITPLMMATGFGLLALVCGTAWLWLIDRLPGFPRYPGPFTRLKRALHRQCAHKKTTLDMAALRTIHTALNAAAGETLYPHTLPRLFVKAPYLAGERTAIEAFFVVSWAQFFGGDTSPSPVSETLAWVERASRAERLYK